MLPTLILSGILLMPSSASGGSASGGSASGGSAPAKLSPATVTPKLFFSAISNQTVSPSSITFSATNPNTLPVVGGSSGATVSWTTTGTLLNTWNLKVTAPAGFTSCPTVPIGAVTVSCGSVSGGTGGTCGGSSALSTAGVQMASGNEGFLVATNYSVTLNFTLQDSWKYIASSSCSLSLTYTITAN